MLVLALILVVPLGWILFSTRRANAPLSIQQALGIAGLSILSATYVFYLGAGCGPSDLETAQPQVTPDAVKANASWGWLIACFILAQAIAIGGTHLFRTRNALRERSNLSARASDKRAA